MIVVIGEALVDLVIGEDGAVDAALGGAPYNTARAAARLGASVEFVGGLSADRFGQLLRAQLLDDGVGVGAAASTQAPTTLAAAEIASNGSASYRFYFDGTSAPLVSSAGAVEAATGLGAGDVFFTGGLGLVLEPMATSVVAALDAVGDDVVIVIDVNCRAAVITDGDAYRARVEHVMARADIVKVSDDDLRYLFPTLAVVEAAQRILGFGARFVVVTAGSAATMIVTSDGVETVEVGRPPAPIVDTIGAGDTFGGGMLAWLTASRVTRTGLDAEIVAAAVSVGHRAAGIVVTRRGAVPPMRDELELDWP